MNNLLIIFTVILYYSGVLFAFKKWGKIGLYAWIIIGTVFANLEVNKLVDYLGGMDNIVDTQVNLSRFIVTLRDISLANKEEIQKLGAKGIVEIDNQLKIILGNNSKQLKRYIDEIKKK